MNLEIREKHVAEVRRDGFSARRWARIWVADWRGDIEVQRLGLDARAVYLELIFLDAVQGFAALVPPEMLDRCATSNGDLLRILAVDARVDLRQMRRIFPQIASRFFVASGGELVNKRGEKERAKAREFREKKRRKAGGKTGKATPMPSSPHLISSPTEKSVARASGGGSTGERDLWWELTSPPWSFGATKARGILERGIDADALDAWELYARERGRAAAVSGIQRVALPAELPEDPARGAGRAWSRASGDDGWITE